MRVGVVLFQLGGPDSPEAVEAFLGNLFRDPDIIDFPFARIAREPLARLIAARRARHVAGHYAEIGGRSPLRELTALQARALEALLRRDYDARVTVAMRYWHPFTADAVRDMERHAPEHLVLLPLYPQYSKTTTGSSVNEWRRQFYPGFWNPRVTLVRDYHDHPCYIGAVAEAAGRSLAEFPDPADVDMVFSAHGVPTAVIEAGDPYQRQVERTVDLVWQRGAWPCRQHLCYQSKVGASKWLEPSTHATLRRLGAQGRRNVLVVPISFVSDHIETLHEIDIEHRAHAYAAGITDYRMMPGLNDSPRFIGALAKMVRASLSEAPREAFQRTV